MIGRTIRRRADPDAVVNTRDHLQKANEERLNIQTNHNRALLSVRLGCCKRKKALFHTIFTYNLLFCRRSFVELPVRDPLTLHF